ncbi:MAG TPA: NAD(P)/FAD-dependent oxidoreductase [Candidatus Paceibacterota bacterium]|nr:NAD(P)/FAD-dependent oxidoreductase [Candidatus Pacearchaeota archaeon]HRZ51077.1 NAD(P)/FAD-dependent oxidoreductase [Candidatus Paceibacterota bacterium]HSA36764.1 NAD(P)/FAD-dependent oxidoreductase [Candidatus Paceibacterota bacterium]
MDEQKKQWDVVIVGAGPAGLFSAYELLNHSERLKVLIVDKGPEAEKRMCPVTNNNKCFSCNPCHIMCGVGGAGIFSDGILNLRPDVVGGDLSDYVDNETEAWKIVDEIDKVFLRFGAPEYVHGTDNEKISELSLKAMSAGIKFVKIRQRHLGSENTPRLIKRFSDYLEQKGAVFMTGKTVQDLIIENDKCLGILLMDNETILAKRVILAPGRVGSIWVDEIVSRHKIKANHAPIDIGVRVEVPAIVMKSVIDVNRDPKFHIWSSKYEDFVRTFCTNHEGFVVKESYGKFIGVNGHSFQNKKSENTNFAFLVRTILTQPLENTTLYGESIAKIATILGQGKPIIQRLGDLRRGKRSNDWRLKKSTFSPTLQDVTPGNIAMVLSHRILTDIMEGLDKLNEVIPGVATDSTFLYAPEIKFYSMKVAVDEKMETSVKNLFAAGDGTGLSRDIVKAAATGLLAARGLFKTL